MVQLAVRHRKLTFVTLAVAALVAMMIAARSTNPVQATSGGDPYVVPLVTDTNPDPNIVETTITAEPAGVDLGGGITASALTFNGSIPGPEFRLKVGDTVIVHFVNNIAHPTGIHWHGIELANPNDGTPLTQDLVQPAGTFEYKFKVTRPGIFWYHPHHHSSTNQVFKGMYGSIIVTDPNEAPLQASGALPSSAQTRTLVLSDTIVCKDTYNPPGAEPSYPAGLPWVGGGPLPAQAPTAETICRNTSGTGYPVDEDGNHRAAFVGGEIPNVQPIAPLVIPVPEGNIVLTNGRNVGGRAGSPSAPGALAPGAFELAVQPGQGLRLQILNTAQVRFFRLIMTDNSGVQIPLVRVGGTGGLLDNARTEGGVVSGFEFKYTSGEILIDPGDRADVVAAIPASATGVITLWTQDFSRTGNGFANIPTVPVAHLNVTGAVVNPAFTIANGTALRAATGDPVPVIGPANSVLLDPSTFTPAELGTPNQNIVLSNQVSGKLGINGIIGLHDNPNPPPFTTFPHSGSSRYTSVGDTLELTTENATSGAHHPFHLHGFSIQPLSLIKTAGGGPDYTFMYHEFRDTIDIPPAYTLHYRVKIEDRPMDDNVTPGGAIGRWVFHCHIFFHAVFGMISELVVVPGAPTLTVPGDQTQDFHDFLTFNISATDPTNDPLTLSSIGLPSGLLLVDHGDGTGTVSGTLTATPGDYLVTFSASDGKNPPVTASLTIHVTKEETGLTYTGPTAILNGGNVTLSAVLKEETDSSGPPIVGRTVDFTLGAQNCSGPTDALGVAQCTILVNSGLGSTPITANFTGDAFYLPSSASSSAFVFAFPTKGVFVLGDLSAASPGTKTFWGSQWSNINALSGGAAPSAFKGFADTVTLPTSTPPASCGSPWSSANGGNSPGPPNTVPSFMGVLVANAATKSGPTTSGNTFKIVVVQTDPGYGPSPGKAGTGTIVATFCQ